MPKKYRRDLRYLNRYYKRNLDSYYNVRKYRSVAILFIIPTIILAIFRYYNYMTIVNIIVWYIYMIIIFVLFVTIATYYTSHNNKYVNTIRYGIHKAVIDMDKQLNKKSSINENWICSFCLSENLGVDDFCNYCGTFKFNNNDNNYIDSIAYSSGDDYIQ